MKTILLIWLIFDIVVYLYMFYDRKDHHYNFKQKLQDFKDSFETEE
ncbi:MAG: hypothetical protein KBT39_03700 [Bacteroidales bacterium]|nr:hypothetical protein [Bacteroidales bacterium]